MRTHIPYSLLLSLFLFTPGAPAADWLQFRGPNGSGMADPSETGVPVSLSEASIAWKLALPGRGLSSPIVIGDKVVVTCSSGPDQQQLHVFCIDALTGKVRWERRFRSTGRTMTHDKTSVAAPTPCSDGKRIFASFSSNDLFCLDLNGNLLWLRGLTYDYPNASNSLGLASSPLVADHTLIVQSENDSESFVVGISVEDGTNRWLLPRPKAANWTSAVIIQSGGIPVVALQSSKGILGVAPATGSELWSYQEGASTIPSSTASGDLLYVPSSGITAIQLSGNTVQKRWRNEQARPKTASPVTSGNRIYFPEGGVLTALNAETGERLWKTRIQGDYSSSPLIANDQLYLVNEAGIVQIFPLPAGTEESQISSELALGETVLCTPAISGGALYIRSDGHLWKLANPRL